MLNTLEPDSEAMERLLRKLADKMRFSRQIGHQHGKMYILYDLSEWSNMH